MPRPPIRARARRGPSVADSSIDQAITDWNNHNAYRSGSLRALIDAKLVSWGHGGWVPTQAGRQRGLNPNHLETSERKVAGHRVADFNTLDDLIAHARDELGATHVLFVDEEIHLYFPRQDGTFEKAEVWQKDGYWHAQGPGARTIVQEPPENARPIGGGKRRVTETQTVKSEGFETRNPKIPGWYVLYKDGTFQGPHPGGEQGAKTLARILSRPELPVKVVYVSGPGHVQAPRQVRDYEAVDSRDRRIAGPFKNYGDAKRAAGPGGHVKYVRPRANEGRKYEGSWKQFQEDVSRYLQGQWRVSSDDAARIIRRYEHELRDRYRNGSHAYDAAHSAWNHWESDQESGTREARRRPKAKRSARRKKR